MSNNVRSLSVAFFALFFFVNTSVLFAQGALMVNPKRIVFEGAKRNDIVTLFNSTDDTTSYAISWQHYEMNPDGTFKSVDSVKTDVKFCDSLIRFFPREVTLGPHGSQTVRMQFLKPKDLPVSEYRSHLYFRAIDRSKALEQKSKEKDTVISINLRAIYGIAIPVIVRNQTKPATVAISNLAISPFDTGGIAMVTADVTRTGDESVYGSYFLRHKDNNGKEMTIGMMKGVATYVPLTMRKFNMQIKKPRNLDLTSGSLVLEYDSLTGSSKETVLASATLPLKK
jgi:P pilus assembly chaperone PapD